MRLCKNHNTINMYEQRRERGRERKEARPVHCPMQERESGRINDQLPDEREIKERKISWRKGRNSLWSAPIFFELEHYIVVAAVY